MSQISARITRENKWFVASCPILDIATLGKTEKEVKENMADLISDYLNDPDTPKPSMEDLGFEEGRSSKHITFLKRIGEQALTTWAPHHREVTVLHSGINFNSQVCVILAMYLTLLISSDRPLT